MHRNEINNCLEHQWGGYRGRFEALSQAQQQDFLRQQGYERLADLLAHVAAWWERGMDISEKLLRDPSYQSPPVDVDAFNAETIASVKDLPNQAIFDQFEETRTKLLAFIDRLSDDQLNAEKVARQLEMEVVGHYQEHKI